jgi:glycosyltransferase involved in cell wall biosynthesis
VRTALITNYLTPYRVPLYERLAARAGLEVLCYGGEGRYVPAWFADLDDQLQSAPFPARRISGTHALLQAARDHDATIAGFAGGAVLPTAFAAAKLHRRAFVLWASIWAQPRSAAHLLALPVSRHIFRHADAVITYGPHASRFIAPFRRDPRDVVVAPQAVEAELFGRRVEDSEVASFRARHGLGADQLVLHCGRLVAEKGVGVLLDAWPRFGGAARLVLIGDGPLAERARTTPGVTLIGPLARAELPVAYAAAAMAVLASVPTPRFLEPWGLVCNEAMHQGRPVVATTAVGAAAGGLVRDGVTGLVVAPADAAALAGAIARLLSDAALRARLGAAGREVVAGYNYDAAADAFVEALERACS